MQPYSPSSIKTFRLTKWTVSYCSEAHIAIRHPALKAASLDLHKSNFFHQEAKLLRLMWTLTFFFFLQKFHFKEIKDHFLFYQKSTQCSCVPLILHRLYRTVNMDRVWATSWIQTRLLSSAGAAVSHAGCCESWACSDNIICPFLARFLLPFSVYCWNTSLYNGFSIQSWSFDSISDLTWSSGNWEHTCQTLNDFKWACTCKVFFPSFCGSLSLRKQKFASFLFTMPLFVL